jgi:hypothetical protein
VSLADPEAVFYREFALRLPAGVPVREFLRAMTDRGFLAGIALPELPGGGSGLLVAVTENRLWKELDAFAAAFAECLQTMPAVSPVGSGSE